MIVSIERDGKKYKAEVPNDAPESTWRYGRVIGPPDISALGLSPSMEVRLHNELFNRGLITNRDIRKRAHELQGALQAALKLDAMMLQQIYEGT